MAKAPKSKEKYEVTIENFAGIDMRSDPSKCDFSRSPYCPNMIRKTKGNNCKRYGYETLFAFEGKINGIHTLKKEITQTIIHAGSKFYLVNTELKTSAELFSAANDHFSVAQQMGGKLYILDGQNYLVFDGTQITAVKDNAYVPVIIIARKPSGGGTTYEPVNLLTPKRTEYFTGDSSTTVYHLTATEIDDDPVTIKSLQSDGTYASLVENTDFTVDRTAGTITFKTVKPTPITEEDNLMISYSKTIEGYTDRICKCDISIIYGINGARDRIFMAGNPDLPHYDWHSKASDPTYFGDTWYCVTGQDSSSIIGYSIINDMLITHKNDVERESNANIRSGTLVDGNVIFKSSGSYPAAGALAKHSFISLENEPLYLTTAKNISAVTPSDVIGERFSQERSYYISSALAEEENLTDAYAELFDGFYMLAVNDKIYILDSLQIITEKNRPYSTRQYECYLWTNIGARVLKTIADRLYFGTMDGKVKRFFNDELGGFTDDGNAMECYWDTTEIYGSHEELKKTFRHMAALLGSYVRTGCRVWAKIDGIWEIIFDYDGSASFFDFSNIDFTNFTFRTDDTPTVVGGKFKVKNVLHIQFRFENSRAEPFSVLFAKIKYTLGNEYIK